MNTRTNCVIERIYLHYASCPPSSATRQQSAAHVLPCNGRKVSSHLELLDERSILDSQRAFYHTIHAASLYRLHGRHQRHWQVEMLHTSHASCRFPSQ